MQAWAPPNSTELRLFACLPYTTVKYDSQMLEESMAYFNQRDRLERGNDQKLQEWILKKYSEAVRLGRRQEGLSAFQSFLSAYHARRR